MHVAVFVLGVLLLGFGRGVAGEECSTLRNEVAGLKSDVMELEIELERVKNELTGCETKVQDLRTLNITLRNKKIQLDNRELQLDNREQLLDNRERALNQRETDLEKRILNGGGGGSGNGCPDGKVGHPPQGPKAGLCERCGECRNGLTCRQGVCERAGGPRCTREEICAPGEHRMCRRLRAEDVEDGMLRTELKRGGMFLGKTEPIEGCVKGMIRFDCARREQVCSRGVFCVEMSEMECRRAGLRKPVDVNKGDVLFVERQTGQCCTVLVGMDCLRKEVCQCVTQ